MWTTFTDISLHGCYVEATTAYRVGVKLGLKLEANGFRVEAIGEVRVSYPHLGMGIPSAKCRRKIVSACANWYARSRDCP